LARRTSLRVARSCVGGSALAVAGFCMLAATQVRDNTSCLVLITVGLASMDVMLPVAWSICLDIGRERAGALSGAMNMSGQAGSLLSSVLFGYAVQWTQSYDLALIPLAVMLLLGAGCFYAIDPRTRVFAERPAELIPAHADAPAPGGSF